MAVPAGFTSYGVPTPQQGQKVAALLQTGSGVTTTGVSSANHLLTWEINPDDLDDENPARVTTVNTLTGAYQDNWGRGIGRLQLSGTTGWRKKSPQGLDGYEFCQALRKLHDDYLALVEQNNPEDVSLTILLPPGQLSSLDQAQAAAGVEQLLSQLKGLLNLGGSTASGAGSSFSQFGYYRVSSDNLQIKRSRSQPLLFSYTWQMTILDDLLASTAIDPSAQFVITGATGATTDPTNGPNPSPPPLSPTNNPQTPPPASPNPGQPPQLPSAPPLLPISPRADPRVNPHPSPVVPPLHTPAPQPATQQQAALTHIVQRALALQQTYGAQMTDLVQTDRYIGQVTAQDVGARYNITPQLAAALTQALNGIALPVGQSTTPTALLAPTPTLIATALVLGRDAGVL